jgi:hypothetical protein
MRLMSRHWENLEGTLQAPPVAGSNTDELCSPPVANESGELTEPGPGPSPSAGGQLPLAVSTPSPNTERHDT